MKIQSKQIELLGSSHKMQANLLYDDGIENIPVSMGNSAHTEMPANTEPPKPNEHIEEVPTMQLERQEYKISGNVYIHTGNHHNNATKTR